MRTELEISLARRQGKSQMLKQWLSAYMPHMKPGQSVAIMSHHANTTVITRHNDQIEYKPEEPKL